MSRISSMARFRVAAALEEEYRGDGSAQQQQPSTSSWDGRRERLPSVSKFLAARRRSKSQSRLLDSQFFFRIVTAFDQHHHHHHPSRIACCHHSHLDDSICGRFMRRNRHFPLHSAETPNGTFGGALHADSCTNGRLNGLGAISGWDISEESCWKELEANSELYSSLQMDMPIKVLNGSPGYINILDGLNAWQLVSELADATGQPAAASFKQFSPAGAAIGVPLNDAEAQALMVADLPLDFRRHSLAVALARAREQNWPSETSNTCKLKQIVGADRMSTFSDFIALSQRCDELTARIISREVSDGVIAPDFDETALSMLAKKKNGNYVVLKIDPKYLPAEDEVRTVFGLKLKQKRNAMPLSAESFADVAVGDGDEITAATVDDLLVACVAVKYAQSNAVCFAHRGQVIGIGAGQQTRLNCTRLAGEKTANWWFRQHPRVLSLPWRANVRRSEKANVVDAIVADVRLSAFCEEEANGGEMSQRRNGTETTPSVTVNGTTMDQRQWDNFFSESVPSFTTKERREWLASLVGVCVASESPFNSRENIDLAKQFGAKFIVTPRGGANDEEICVACEERSIVLIHTANAQTMR